MGRGRERMVVCEKCGRQVRRDKAVFLERPVFMNPLDRKDVADEQYTPMITREFAYCPGCGKHGRIYEKKKQQQQRQKERMLNRGFYRGPRPPFHHGPRPTQPQPAKPAAAPAPATETAPQPAAPEASAPAVEAQPVAPEAPTEEEGGEAEESREEQTKEGTQ